MIINRKGQGLTEYGIILLLVLLIGSFVYFTTDIKGQLSALYGKAGYKMEEISSGTVLDLGNPSATLDTLLKAYRIGIADRSTITNSPLMAGKYLDAAAQNLGNDVIKDFAQDPNVDYKAYYYKGADGTYTIQSVVLHNVATGKQYIEYADGSKYSISGSKVDVGDLGRNKKLATVANGVTPL